MNKTILIGGAWPYANGSLHIGHIAGLLPGDVIARYYRANGDDVYYVSGSDCYGTPVTIRAKEEQTTPDQISNKYHEEFLRCFNKLGFQYDYYGKTTMKEHGEFVKDFHKALYNSKYIYEKTIPQAYCEHCERFLADRYVVGICPNCGEPCRGDQCDQCGTVIEPEIIVEPQCSLCGNVPIFKETKHLFLAITKLKNELQVLVDSHPNWRKNAITLTNRYIKDGLKDRAITRDLEWGIDVLKEGYEDKKVYIWAENVLGYLSMSQIVARERGTSFEKIWGEDAIHYYIHAKDNIPFHTIILPSLLLAHGAYNREGAQYHLPDYIISNEYLTLEGRKISTSKNWAIWMKDMVESYQADSIRYFLITNGPEKRDTDFNFREFVNSHNGELLGAYGNFVNRSLVFIEKYFDSTIPEGSLNQDTKEYIQKLYRETGYRIENGFLKEGIDTIFEFIRYANKYFDNEKPWETRKTDVDKCKRTLYNCVQIIANLAILLAPFLPFSSDKIIGWLSLKNQWKMHIVKTGHSLPKINVLYERIDKDTIKNEVEKL